MSNTYLDEDGLRHLIPKLNVFHGTKLEWEQLSTSQKKQYTSAAIEEDAESLYATSYSTVEAKTAEVWIDNKPIYRIVLESSVTSLASGAWTNFVTTTLGTTMETLVRAYLVCHEGRTAVNSANIKVTDSNVQYYIDSAQSVSGLRVVLEYTKVGD